MKYFEFGQQNPELMVMLHGGGVSYRGVLPVARKMASSIMGCWLPTMASTPMSRRRSLNPP